MASVTVRLRFLLPGIVQNKLRQVSIVCRSLQGRLLNGSPGSVCMFHWRLTILPNDWSLAINRYSSSYGIVPRAFYVVVVVVVVV